MSKINTALNLLKNNRGEFIASIIQNFFTWLPDSIYLTLLFRFRMGKPLNLKNPKTFNEKLQWLKLYNRKPEYTTMVDKYAVKQYVANIIGDKYIIPTLGVWDKFDDIDFSSLPDQFVLKTTHGGGGGGVVICRDKQTFDKATAKRKLESSMKSDIYKSLREWPYKNVKKRIIAEKFMAPDLGMSDLLDYKFYCFNGEPKLIMVAGGRQSGNKRFAYYDTEWNSVDIQWGAPRPDKDFEKPMQLEQMLKVAAQLSSEIPHARIDLYCIQDNVFFGEITMFDASGLEKINPSNMDEYLGSLINLPANKATWGGGKYLIVNGIAKPFKLEYDELKDYKFFCFNGKVKFFKVDFGRFVEHHANYYDTDGNLLPFGEKSFEPDPSYNIELPNNLNEMISLAERLSMKEPFLRVDFYNVNGNIYFGELTFYPASGMGKWTTEEADVIIGNYL